jgi:sortase (surface protein transpeptidase)
MGHSHYTIVVIHCIEITSFALTEGDEGKVMAMVEEEQEQQEEEQEQQEEEQEQQEEEQEQQEEEQEQQEQQEQEQEQEVVAVGSLIPVCW